MIEELRIAIQYLKANRQNFPETASIGKQTAFAEASFWRYLFFSPFPSVKVPLSGDKKLVDLVLEKLYKFENSSTVNYFEYMSLLTVTSWMASSAKNSNNILYYTVAKSISRFPNNKLDWDLSDVHLGNRSLLSDWRKNPTIVPIYTNIDMNAATFGSHWQQGQGLIGFSLKEKISFDTSLDASSLDFLIHDWAHRRFFKNFRYKDQQKFYQLGLKLHQKMIKDNLDANQKGAIQTVLFHVTHEDIIFSRGLMNDIYYPGSAKEITNSLLKLKGEVEGNEGKPGLVLDYELSPEQTLWGIDYLLQSRIY